MCTGDIMQEGCKNPGTNEMEDAVISILEKLSGNEKVV
jgi:hypothetical protein